MDKNNEAAEKQSNNRKFRQIEDYRGVIGEKALQEIRDKATVVHVNATSFG
jgi:hypothetical protein